MTEDEAKEKWCPFSRVLTPVDSQAGGGAGNRSWDGALLESRCYGSACMAWRWIERAHHRDVELWSKSKNKRVTSAYSDDADWRPVKGEKDDDPPPATGYCGLAGVP